MNFLRYHYDLIGSTSDKALEILKEQKSFTPFVVTAFSQTKGRGQNQRSWQSPKGNGYLTFAVNPDFLTPKNCTLVPAYVSLVLIKVLKSIFDIEAIIKWPNDILYSGKKLAGILCEASTSSTHLNHVLIGIGINVNHSPVLDTQKNTAISLKEILTDSFLQDHPSLNIETFLSSFIEKFEKVFMDSAFFGSFLSEYQTSLILKGQKFLNSDNNHDYYLDGLTSDGFLKLYNSNLKEFQTLYSPDPHLRWVYQNPIQSDFSLALCDIGNTAIKIWIKTYSKDQKHSYKKIVLNPDDTDADTHQKISRLFQEHFEKINHIYYVSVNQPKVLHLKSILKKHDIDLISIPSRTPSLRKSSYAPTELGRDRLALIEGACNLKEPSHKIIIGLGTATTVDIVLKNNHHIGGYILSGVQTSLDSLFINTDKLPKIDVAKENNLISKVKSLTSNSIETTLGKNTKEAIFLGTMYQVLHLKEGMVKLLNDQYPDEKVSCLITGGYSYIFENDPSLKVCDTLLIDGMSSMILGG